LIYENNDESPKDSNENASNQNLINHEPSSKTIRNYKLKKISGWIIDI